MYKAIETKYLGPTNTRGSRIKAAAEGGLNVTVSYEHALNAAENHTAAARALAEKMSWGGRYVGGGKADGRGYVFVRVTTVAGGVDVFEGFTVG